MLGISPLKKSLLALFLCYFSACSSTDKKQSYEELENQKYLGDGYYEQIDSSHYSSRDTNDIDNFIDSAPEYRETEKKKVTMVLDQTHSAEIRKVIIRNIPLFKDCYIKHYRKKRSKIRGQVTLNFTLNDDGKVQRAGMGESKLSIKIKACLVETVYRLRFPPSPNGDMVRVKQPLKF